MPSSSLHVGQVGGRSVLLGARAHSPLTLLNPAHDGLAAWVYQSSHGGGWVGEDAVHLEVAVDAGATLFLSTQASSKVYRQARAEASLTTRVGPGAALVVWPDPTVCFAGAGLVQRQHHALDAAASLLLVEVVSAGRVARGERWAFASYRSRLEVTVAGRPCLAEAVLLSPEGGLLAARLEGVEALATVVLLGPALEGASQAVSQAALEVRPSSGVLLAAGHHRGALVLRAAGRHGEALGAALRALLAPAVTALLGADPLRRKW
jgi:urease accessory protein